jgi:L-xylulokinase
MEIEISDTDEAGTRGAAILAGLGIGVWPDLESAVAATVRVARKYTPEPARAAAFDRTHATFQELADVLAPLWARL